MPSDRPMLAFQIDRDLLRAVDKFRFSHEFPSRAATILALLRWALAQNPDLQPE